MERTENNGVEYLNFTGLDQRMAYRFPGPAGLQSAGNNNVQQAIRAVAKLDDATMAAKRDPRLSPAGRVEQVAPQRKRRRRRSPPRQRAWAARSTASTPRGRRSTRPRRSIPTDAVGAQVDAEIRARWGGLPDVQTAAIRADVAAGRNDRALLALARDPLPSQEREWALALWAERVERRHGERVAALDAAAADAEWALSALAALKNVLDRSAAYGIGLEQGATA